MSELRDEEAVTFGSFDAQAWPGRDAELSCREGQIIALITLGYSNQEIAERTCLSINSVKSYIRTAYWKLGLNRRTHAVLWGITHGLHPDLAPRSAPKAPRLWLTE